MEGATYMQSYGFHIIAVHCVYVSVSMCVEEIPIVRISGSNNGQAVNPGDGILLECTAERGFPNPEVLFRATDGQDLPSTITRVGDRLLLEVTNIKRDFCVTCEGSNTAGKASDEICVEVVRKLH